jgi:hypothetical protein
VEVQNVAKGSVECGRSQNGMQNGERVLRKGVTSVELTTGILVVHHGVRCEVNVSISV